MPATKFTMVFQQATGQSIENGLPNRVGGWTESWYRAEVYPFSALVDLQVTALMATRAALLPSFAAIVGQRYQVVDPVGRSATAARKFPGASSLAQDVPNLCLYARARSTSANIRPVYLRGLPDSVVVRGEFAPTPGFQRDLTTFYRQLTGGGWLFEGVDLAAPQFAIASITTGGLITWAEPIPYNDGDRVTIIRTELANGRRSGGTYRLSSVSAGITGQLINWDLGACVRGTTRAYTLSLHAVSALETSRVLTKKVGGVFDRYRGRASNRN